MTLIADTAISLADGRRLAYTEWGDPTGPPVFFFYGFPGSRLWCPDEDATDSAHVRLIIPDRPGIGGSDVQVARTLADWPTDMLALADALAIERFAIVGLSDGGPFAAACAALIPARLTAAGIVSSRAVARLNMAERPAAYGELPVEWRAEYDLAQHDPFAAAELAANHSAKEIAQLDAHPEVPFEELMAAKGDRWFLADPRRSAIFDAVREGLRQGMDALRWEFIDIWLPWGFRLADIPIHVDVWHGEQDPWVTKAHVDFTVSTIPDCSLVVWPDSGHLGFVKHWGEILEALAARASPWRSTARCS